MDFLSEKTVQPNDHPLANNGHGKDGDGETATRVLPVLALNDVFVGESLSSRVSNLVKVYHERNA